MDDESDSDGETVLFDPAQAAERLKQAKKRRNQQLKRWSQYEKELQRGRRAKGNHVTVNVNVNVNGKERCVRVRFTNNIVLFDAVCRGDLNEVQQLLRQGCSANVLNTDGLTALHQACIDDNESVCKLLLEHGANVNAADSEYWTPLHAAATCGNLRVCKLLIDNGANLLAVNSDANMPYDGCEDSTTLSLLEDEMSKRGITQDQIDLARSERENKLLQTMRAVVDSGGSVDNLVDENQKATCLHVASAYGFQKLAEYLLEHGASHSVADVDGWLPLHAAACWGCFNIVQLLVQHGADIDARTRSGEQVYDICSDGECKRQLLALKEQLKRMHSSQKSNRRKLSTPAENKPNRSNSRRNSVRSDRRSSISQKEAEVDGNLRALAAASLSSSCDDTAGLAESETLNRANSESEQRSSGARRANGRLSDGVSGRSSASNGSEAKLRDEEADQNSGSKSERLKAVARRCVIN